MADYLLRLPDWQMDALRSVREQTGVKIAEILRQVIGEGLRRERLDEQFPALSGRIQLVR